MSKPKVQFNYAEKVPFIPASDKQLVRKFVLSCKEPLLAMLAILGCVLHTDCTEHIKKMILPSRLTIVKLHKFI